MVYLYLVYMYPCVTTAWSTRIGLQNVYWCRQYMVYMYSVYMYPVLNEPLKSAV